MIRPIYPIGVGMSVSSTFDRYNRDVIIESSVSDKPEEWEMSDSVMTHLFAQVRHIQARMTASTQMSDVTHMVASRSSCLNFQIALGCAVMTEWCYLRMESASSDSPDKSWYETLMRFWDDKYEKAVKYYNAPIAVLTSQLDSIATPVRD